MITVPPVSRATGPRTSMFPVISLVFHVTITIYARVMAVRLDSPLRRYDVLPLVLSSVRRFPLRPYVTRTSRLAGFRYAQSSTRFVYPLVTYPTGRYSCLLPLRTLRLFVLVSPVLVYILGWRWDDPHLQSTLQPP